MKLSHVAIAVALSATVSAGLPAYSNDSVPSDNSDATTSHYIRVPDGQEPHWPTSGIAERELGDGVDLYPENMFVEYAKGKWHVWVIASPVHGKAKVLDFFSGEVLDDVKVKNPGEYNDAFVDARGIVHRENTMLDFQYKDPRSGGALGDESGTVQFSAGVLTFEGSPGCGTLYLYPLRRVAMDYKTVIWRKVPLYKRTANTTCAGGKWGSAVGTALDLRDGSMLIVGGKYVFRVRMSDLTPVGEAPHLHVVDATDVQHVIEQAKGKDIDNASSYLTDHLQLQ